MPYVTVCLNIEGEVVQPVVSEEIPSIAVLSSVFRYQIGDRQLQRVPVDQPTQVMAWETVPDLDGDLVSIATWQVP